MKKSYISSGKLIPLILLFGIIFFHSFNYTPASKHPVWLTEVLTLEQLEYDSSFLFVLFGRDSCSSCIKALNAINERITSKNISILYFDTDFWRDKDGYSEVLKKYSVTEVPTIVYFSGNAMFSQTLLKNGAIDIALLDSLLL